MSIHYLERAGELRMQATRKLVLMALCDDADKTTGLAMPGIEKVMQWAGCGRSQAADHMAALIEAGYVERVTKGHSGQRAVYRVFAAVACCAEHPVPIESGRPDANSGGDNLIGSGQPDPNPETDESIASGEPDAIQSVEARKESGWPDAKSSNASGVPDANPERVRKGSGKGPVGRTPSVKPLTPKPKNPPTGDSPAHARGTRIPADFVPTDQDWHLMASKCPDVTNPQDETEQFRDYWTAATGKGAVKKDWDAAWRYWMREAQKRATRYGGPKKTPTTTSRVQAALSLVDELRAEEANTAQLMIGGTA